MKTTVEIDDAVFKRLCQLTKTQKKGEAIRTAVDGYLKNESKKRLLELCGSGIIADDYDYKAWRRQEHTIRVK